jgi:hypothetical protein
MGKVAVEQAADNPPARKCGETAQPSPGTWQLAPAAHKARPRTTRNRAQGAAGGLVGVGSCAKTRWYSSRPKRPVFTDGFERHEQLCIAHTRQTPSAKATSMSTMIVFHDAPKRASPFLRNGYAAEGRVASTRRPDRNRQCVRKSHEPGPIGNLSQSQVRRRAAKRLTENAPARIVGCLRAMYPRQTPRPRPSELTVKVHHKSMRQPPPMNMRCYSRLPQRTSRSTATAPPDFQTTGQGSGHRGMLIPSHGKAAD